MNWPEISFIDRSSAMLCPQTKMLSFRSISGMAFLNVEQTLLIWSIPWSSLNGWHSHHGAFS